MRQLPEKIKGSFDEWGAILTEVEAKINDIIDYLAERERKEDHTPDRPLNNERE